MGIAKIAYLCKPEWPKKADKPGKSKKLSAERGIKKKKGAIWGQAPNCTYIFTLIVMVLPLGQLAVIVPPWVSATALAMARPTPVPPVLVLLAPSGL